MILPLSILTIGCSATWLVATFEREEFEDHWWELSSYDVCYNMHNGDGRRVNEDQLLIRPMGEDLYSLGEWVFVDPNIYEIDGYKVSIYPDNDCWLVRAFGQSDEVTCECPE